MKTEKKSILFIDSTIANAPDLLANIDTSSAKVVFLNAKTNTLSQIVTALQGQKNLDAIHIISHGASGELDFANGTLTSENISQNTPLLKKIGQSLSKDGDILLYGCDIAKGEKGVDFVNLLANLTHADIAASNDLTGASALGGDWDLEVHSGKIESAAISAPNYQGLLLAAPSSVKDAAGNIFLLGKYFELGISPDGNFGTSASPPTGYYKGIGETKVGMVYNPFGFGTGHDAYNIDFFLPGNPFEIFTVGYIQGATTAYGTNYNLGSLHQVTNVSLTNTSSGNTLSATYVGIYNAKLQVTITYSFGIDDLYYSANVTLKNISASTLNDARYMRMVNADNTTDYTGNYNTVNTIQYQQPTSGSALVLASNPTNDSYQLASGYPTIFGYYSTDPNTRVANGFNTSTTPVNPFDLLAYATVPAVGSTNTANYAISLTYDAGQLLAGESKSFTYSSLLTSNVASTVAAINSDTPPTFIGGVNAGLTIAQNAAITPISNTILKVVDAEQGAALLTYTITTATTKGTLSKSGVSLTVGDTFAQNDIDTGKITYAPTVNLNGADSLTFSVTDGAGGTITGQTFNISITPVNTPHTGAPSISGTPIPNNTLTAAMNTLADADGFTSLTWQWQASSDGITWTDITGATASTYTLTTTESAKLVRVQASWVGGGFAENEVSNTKSIDPNLAAITASSALIEPIALPSTATSTSVDVFDFTINDGVSDGLPTLISQIVLNTSGSADFNKVKWLLNGSGITTPVEGIYNNVTNTLTFPSLNISVANTQSQTYTVSAYFTNNTGLIDGQTYGLSLAPNSGVNVATSGSTQLQLAQTTITNGTGSAVDVIATKLVFNTQPDGSVSGSALTTQPMVNATDAVNNVDLDFTGTVVLSENSSGSLSGYLSLAETLGVASFSGISYTATADHETFQISASTAGLATAVSTAVDSNVVATKLEFSTQPSPTSIENGGSTLFTAVPVVRAVDAQNVLDIDYNTPITLSVTDPIDGILNGTVTSLTSTVDTDGIAMTVTQNLSSGSATFSGLTLQYTSATASDNLAFHATSGSFVAVNSQTLTANSIPSVTAINRASVSPTNANVVNYTITFSENVSGVDTSDFSLFTSDISGASISSVSGSGANYTVSVNTGLGDGTLRLDLSDDDSILSANSIRLGGAGLGNGNFSSGQSYSIDKTPPTLSINTVALDDKINAQEDDNSIAISGTTSGAEDGQIVTVTVGGLTKTATVNSNLWSVSLSASEIQSFAEGTLNINATVSDVVSNAATPATKNIIYNKTPPTCVITSSDYIISRGETATITFTFSEIVTGFTAADISVSNGSISTPLTTNGGLTWTAIYTPTVDIESATNLITVDNSGVTDSAGNTGTDVTNSQNYSVDTLSPTITSIVRQIPSVATTNADTLTFRVTFREAVQNVDANDFIVTGTSATISTVSAVSGNTYDVTVSGGDLATLNGTIQFALSAGQNISDSVNNSLTNLLPTSINNSTYVLDNFTATPMLALMLDTGNSTTDAITSNGNITVSGLESGATWEFSTDNATTWTSGTGSTFSVNGDGNKSVLVRQMDVLGNVSAIAALNFILDTLVTLPTLTLAVDSGSDANDKLTNDGTIIVAGLESGAKWEWSTDNVNWNLGNSDRFTLVSDGAHQVFVRQTDVAGNISNNATLNLVLDSTVLPPVLTLETPVGNITKTGVVTVSGIETNASWQYSLDAGNTWISGTNNSLTLNGDGNKTVIARQTDFAGNISVNSVALTFTLDTTATLPILSLTNDTGKNNFDRITSDGTVNVAGIENGASWQFSTDNLTWTTGNSDNFCLFGDGEKAVFVRQIDVVGNFSPASLLTFTLDTQVATPVLELVNDTGIKNDDALTGDGTVKVSNLENGADWQYSTDNGNTWTTGNGDRFTLYGDGNKTILVKQTDLAGNKNLNSTVLNFTLDTSVATPSTVLSNDSGKAANDFITRDGTFDVIGLEAGASWCYSLDNGVSWLIGSDNHITLQGDGNKTVLIQQTDLAGNVSQISSPLHFLLDTQISKPILSLATDSPNINDHAANVSGIESGASWEFSPDGIHWTTGNGNKLLVSDEIKFVLVRQTDVAGNVSGNVKVSFLPNVPTLKLLTDSGRQNDNVTNNGTVSVSNLESGFFAWQYSIDNGKTWTKGSGDQFTLTGDGIKNVIARQIDDNGNLSIHNGALNFTLDTLSPPPTLALINDSGQKNDFITNDGSVTVSNLEPDATWQYSLDNGKTWAAGIEHRLTVTGDDGIKTVLINQTDIAENLSANSELLTFTLDTQVNLPTIKLRTDSGNPTDNLTNDGTVVVSNLEDGASWQYSTNSGATWLNGKNDSFVLTGDGNKTVLVRQTDLAGNTNLNYATLNFTLNSQIKTPTLNLVNDTGKAKDDSITADGTINVSDIEQGTTWEFSEDGKIWSLGSNHSFTLINDGLHNAFVRESDSAGNQKISEPLAFTLDTTPPVLDSVQRDDFELLNDSTSFTVQVNYSDSGSGIDTKTISLKDISVSGTADLTVANVTFNNNTAIYTIAAPKDGWKKADVGTYKITLNADEIKDIAGNSLEPLAIAKTFEILPKKIIHHPDTTQYLVETDSVLNAAGQITDLPKITAQKSINGQFGTFNIDELGNWTYTTNSPHNEFLQDKIYLDTFPIQTTDDVQSNVIIQITGTKDVPILVDDLSKQVLIETQIDNVTKNVLHGQVVLQSIHAMPIVQNADKSWSDLDEIQLLFELKNSKPVGVDEAGHSLVQSTLENGSIFTLNTWDGSYSYIPSAALNTNKAIDQFEISADGVSLFLNLNPLDLSDLDGVSPELEEQLANLATPIGEKQTGDLNHDNIEDKSQGGVANIAWGTYQDFKAAQENTLTSPNSIINIVVAKEKASEIDDSAQLSHIAVLPSDSSVIGGSKPTQSDTLQTPWDPITFSVDATTDAGLTDMFPNRAGLQTKVIIDVSRAAENFNAYLKYVSAQTIEFYNAAENSLITLDGEKLTSASQAGWYDFTQRTPNGDGARFVKAADGTVQQIEIILTDNAFGDDNPASNHFIDPGVPVIKNPEPTTLQSSITVTALPTEFQNLILEETLVTQTVTKTEWIDNPLLCLPKWRQELLHIPAKIEKLVTTTEKVTAPLNGVGNALNNQITGNSAANILSGLAGKDILTGGAGADTFAYQNVSDSLSAIHDVITDFSALQGDKIDLSAVDANSNQVGKQLFHYIGTADFTKQAAQLRFDSATHQLQGDTNGDGKAEFVIELSGISNFASDALILKM